MKTLKRGFTLVELMIVVAIIGILAAIAIPNFVRFQARSKQAEAKADLKAIFTGQKAFYADHDAYSTLTGDIGFAPERGNRYAYAMVNTNPLTAAIAEDRTTAIATPATTTSNGFSVDRYRYPGELAYPTINTTGIGTVTWNRVATGTTDPPGYVGGIGGTCPLCTFEASAVGNIDGETAGLDVQVVSSEFIDVAASICAEAQTHVTPGAAAIVYNDVNCGN